MKDTILGLNAYHGDSSAALLVKGDLAAAIEEERLLRIKHWAGLPVKSAFECLRIAGIDEPEHVAISRDPKAQILRKALYVAVKPDYWKRAIGRIKNNLYVARANTDLGRNGAPWPSSVQFHHVEHHRAHMASAFFASPFEEAAVVSVDGFGDFSSVMWGVGRGNQIDVLGNVSFPHSAGLFYTAFTQFLGFLKYGDEYKMMGLSAYGEPRFADRIRQVISISDDQIRLNLDYFRHHSEGVEMSWEGGEPTLGAVFSNKFVETFGAPRVQRAELTQRDMDMAASAQKVLEEVYFSLLRYVQKRTGQKALCLAGGVALNCVANGMLFANTDFRDVYIQPAAHDAGTSIGAALFVWHQKLGKPRSYVMRHVYYGSDTDDNEIGRLLRDSGTCYHRLDRAQLLAQTAGEIAAGNIVGWYQGRMEFGPRALGNRSILADPRRPDMKDILNRRIKYREPFRPFCPSILAERTGDYFETSYSSPFMVMAYKIRADQQERIPAVTHQDGTGRLQTVERDVNPLYWDLIHEFEQITGVPVLINTSFNENEPIVTTPEQALDCFLRTHMDTLVMGSYMLLKKENEASAAARRAQPEMVSGR